MEIVSHPERTRGRCVRVQAYMNAHVLRDDRAFVCNSLAACLASCRGLLYFPGQLHHIGNHYDLTVEGRETRIVVLGQEYGSPHVGVTLDERRDGIRRSAQAGFSGRNPHMRGTTSILRLLLGRALGDEAEGEVLMQGTSTHLFDGFALVNTLLCSAISEISGSGSAKGRASPTMFENCGRHLREVLQILAPTIVVVQGVGISWWVRRALGLPDYSAQSELVQLFGKQTLLFTFYHPSAGGQAGWWGNSIRSGYLTRTVAPVIRQHFPFAHACSGPVAGELSSGLFHSS